MTTELQIGTIEQNIPIFNLTIHGIDDKGNLFKLLSLLFPKYQTQYIRMKVLNKGHSNKLVKIDYNQPPYSLNELSSLLVRIYGDLTSSLIDRTNEMKCIRIFRRFDSFQQIYAVFNNGFVYSYYDGCDISFEKLSDMKYSRLIAEKLAQLHCLPADEFNEIQNGELFEENNMEPKLFSTLLKWIDRLEDEFISSSRKLMKYEFLFPSKSYVLNEVNKLKDHYLTNPISNIVICHNDLNAANVILAPDENSVHFIDMEYCDINYAAYDIANHFCEFTGPHAVDTERYPSLKFQKNWLKIYLTAYYKYSQSQLDPKYNDSQINVLTEDYLNLWLKEVNCFALVSHLLWAVWAVICASENLDSMDFLAYADARMKHYYDMKNWLPSAFRLPVV
ncbi:hypothetical protein MN116_008543 [Schistosoma mekongi]|uniref:ethanolamine kinase n=1 Tax=Schistosoma mekongi TaxID=38744 RepID=A0AAE2D1Q3_SCHME|nr:hypothetical protein MN116_008543 [Schistosoma mekongi]